MNSNLLETNMTDKRIITPKADHLNITQQSSIMVKIIAFSLIDHTPQRTAKRSSDNMAKITYTIIRNNHDLIAIIIDGKQPLISDLMHLTTTFHA